MVTRASVPHVRERARRSAHAPRTLTDRAADERACAGAVFRCFGADVQRSQLSGFGPRREREVIGPKSAGPSWAAVLGRLKTKKAPHRSEELCGEDGIRTRENLRSSRFSVECFQPLSHLWRSLCDLRRRRAPSKTWLPQCRFPLGPNGLRFSRGADAMTETQRPRVGCTAEIGREL